MPDPRNLRMRIDHRRNRLVVHLGEVPSDQVGDHHALFLALVRQHRPTHTVADGPNAFDARAAFVIHLNESALIQLHTRAITEQILGERTAADGHDDLVDLQGLGSALVVGVSDVDRAPSTLAPVTFFAPRRISSPCFLK